MQELEFKPEKELKTLWIITWVILLVIALIILAVLFLFTDIVFFIVFGSLSFIFLLGFIVWIPKAFKVLEYHLDEDGVKVRAGVVWKKFVTVPYQKITNVDITQGPLERHYRIATIHVQTAGAGGKQGEKAEIKLAGVREFDRIRDMIIGETKRPKIVKGQLDTEDRSKSDVLSEILLELRQIKSNLKK